MAALAVVVALFIVLAGSDAGPDSAATQPQRAPGTTAGHSKDPQSTAGTTAGWSKESQRPAIERIVVRDGTPVGGVRRLEYDSGEHVRFTVRSDVADEVHVHGFDVQKDVPAKGSVRFGFPADIEGVFDVELHDSEIKIAELRITP